MDKVIKVVRGAEWVIPASLRDSSDALVSSIVGYTISADIIAAADGAVLLPLTVGNGRVEIGATAADITFRVQEADTAGNAAVPIPLGRTSKLKITVVEPGGRTHITACWLNNSRDGD